MSPLQQDRLTLSALMGGAAATAVALGVWTVGPEASLLTQGACLALLGAIGVAALLHRAGHTRAAHALFVAATTVLLVPLVSRFWGIDGHLGAVLVLPVLAAGLVGSRPAVVATTVVGLAFVGVELAFGPPPWSLGLEREASRLERAQDLAAVLVVAGILTLSMVHQHRAWVAASRAREQEARQTADRLADVEGRQREAMDAALAASRAKSSFLASMSHELRTPLNAILGYGEMLREDAEGGESQADIDRILSSGRHLLALIDEVLDMSRVEAGSLEVTCVDVDLGALVREVRDAVLPQASARGVTLEVPDLAPGARATVRVDRRRARQVLLNLLSNAVKFARSGVGMDIRVGRSDVDVDVRDDGDGVPADVLPRLFEPFARGGNSSGGTGLGLALSRELARRMGGDLALVATDGSGARFRLRLPRSTDVGAVQPYDAENPPSTSRI